MLISVLIAAATGPINMLVDFLFEDVISAPLADEYKVAARSREFRQRVGRRFSAMGSAARDAVRNSISLARNSISPIVASSINQNTVQHPTSRFSFSRLASTILEQFAVPDATLRKVPPAVVSSHSSTAAVLQGVFGDQYQSNVDRHRHRLNADDHEFEDMDMDASRFQYDSMERGGGTSSNGINYFTAEVLRQYDQLNEYSRREFRERWGFELYSDDIWGSKSRQRKKKRSVISSICGTYHNANRKDILSKELAEVEQESERKIAKLSIAPDSHIGLEIMHLFIIDLLG